MPHHMTFEVQHPGAARSDAERLNAARYDADERRAAESGREPMVLLPVPDQRDDGEDDLRVPPVAIRPSLVAEILPRYFVIGADHPPDACCLVTMQGLGGGRIVLGTVAEVAERLGIELVVKAS